MDFKGKRALVTGGAVRIGRAICEALAARGAHVGIHYHRSYAAAQELQAVLEGHGVEAHLLEANLMTETACNELMERARAVMGGVDILVNNASVFHKHTLDAADMDTWLGELWPNFFAPVQLMRALAAAGSPARVVNLLDRRITTCDPAAVPYWISKRALADVTRAAALHYAPRLTVNAVAPGAVLPPPGQDGSYLKEFAGPVPLDVQVTPADVARAVLFLLENDTLTGQVLYTDGGQHLQPNPPGDVS